MYSFNVKANANTSLQVRVHTIERHLGQHLLWQHDSHVLGEIATEKRVVVGEAPQETRILQLPLCARVVSRGGLGASMRALYTRAARCGHGHRWR